MDVKKPTIALLQGDPTGIGPELLVKLLNSDGVTSSSNILIVGDPRVLGRAESATGNTIRNLRHISEPAEIEFSAGEILHLDMNFDDIDNVPFAKVSAAGGRSSIGALHQALDLTQQALVHGICFMPFNKEFMHLGGNAYNDEMGYAKQFFGVENMVINALAGAYQVPVVPHAGQMHNFRLTVANMNCPIHPVEVGDQLFWYVSEGEPDATNGLIELEGDVPWLGLTVNEDFQNNFEVAG